MWYRGSAREEARRLGLKGWARNRGDGSVEILVEGPPAAVSRFVEWCGRGPPAARVQRVDERPEPAGEDLTDFRVRY